VKEVVAADLNSVVSDAKKTVGAAWKGADTDMDGA
jgi:hypothetical protein